MDRVFSKTGVDIYNLGTGKGYSVLELLTAFEEASGKEIPRRVMGPARVILPNPTQSRQKRKRVGLKPKETLKMCEDTWNGRARIPMYEE